MMTVAAMEPIGARRSDSGRTPRITSGPAPRTRSPTSSGRETDAPGNVTAMLPCNMRPVPAAPMAAGAFSTSIPSTRFIPGLPKKRATKALAGQA